MEGAGGRREVTAFGAGVDDSTDDVGGGTLKARRFGNEGGDSLTSYGYQIYLHIAIAKVQYNLHYRRLR